MHITAIAAAAGSGKNHEFCENADAAAPSTHRPTTAARGYFASVYRDQRPDIHNICSAVHFNVESAVVKVDHETRRYSRLLKNRGARLLNTGLKKSQTHSYPAHIL